MNKNNLFLTLLLCVSSTLYAENNISHTEKEKMEESKGEKFKKLKKEQNKKFTELKKKTREYVKEHMQKLKEKKRTIQISYNIVITQLENKLNNGIILKNIIECENAMKEYKIMINELYEYFEKTHININEYVDKEYLYSLNEDLNSLNQDLQSLYNLLGNRDDLNVDWSKTST